MRDVNLLIPMAGTGQRFKAAGYEKIKPLIDVAGVSMIHRVIENFYGAPIKRIRMVAQKEHAEEIESAVQMTRAGCGVEVVALDGPTEGAAETVLKGLTNGPEYWAEEPLVVANCDQIIDWSPKHFFDFMRRTDADGGVPTFVAIGNKWSYAAVNDDGVITRIEEKVEISRFATVGIYYYKKTLSCVSDILAMMSCNDRTNGEFYFAPAYNYSIGAKATVLNYPVPRMYGLGTPEDLQAAVASGYFTRGRKEVIQ